MNKELDEQLCQKYPALYRDRNGDKGDTSMCWGFACGDGWHTLIDVISELLTKHDPNICAVQIKQKLGGLCFYHDSGDDYALGVEMTAFTISKTVCEMCGAPGILNNKGGWLSTLCDEHGDQHSAADNRDIDISSVADLRLGAAWSRLCAILKNSAHWHTEHNGRPASTFFINKGKNGRLLIKAFSDDQLTRGMVDIIAGYANRIDEHSGMVIGG
ncbi:MAG: hypothetical protein PSU93_15030 [Methylobacter sp.]|uniref:Uncharacterized protein n=1 Tax=Candidatus Methylobacter titanis TaxID=3053457 RepID=A0AA43TLP1_9GAMM|nr:hypothetical protein [Candidatus Methylobacter titanis]